MIGEHYPQQALIDLQSDLPRRCQTSAGAVEDCSISGGVIAPEAAFDGDPGDRSSFGHRPDISFSPERQNYAAMLLHAGRSRRAAMTREALRRRNKHAPEPKWLAGKMPEATTLRSRTGARAPARKELTCGLDEDPALRGQPSLARRRTSFNGSMSPADMIGV